MEDIFITLTRANQPEIFGKTPSLDLILTYTLYLCFLLRNILVVWFSFQYNMNLDLRCDFWSLWHIPLCRYTMFPNSFFIDSELFPIEKKKKTKLTEAGDSDKHPPH